MLLQFPREVGGDEVTVRTVLGNVVGPVLRGIRKHQALAACYSALPEALRTMAAPFDVRLAGPAAQDSTSAELNTAYYYVASATVETLMEQHKPALLREINAALGESGLVEEFRYEQTSPARIAEQVNNLSARPD